MANSADPGQLASSEANWSGSTLFARTGYIQVQQESYQVDDGVIMNDCAINLYSYEQLCLSLDLNPGPHNPNIGMLTIWSHGHLTLTI